MTAGESRSGSSSRPRHVALGLVVVAWGIQAVVTQSLLLREALVLMFGSELAWGLVLCAWLLGVAGGAVLGGRLAERARHPTVVLALVLLVLSIVTCVELWALRGARAWLGVGPGELLPLTKTALAAVLFVTPAGALVGMAFPLTCCAGRETDHRPWLGFGPVYALESAGSLVGGAAFSFWAVEHLAPLQSALACGAVTATAAALLLLLPRRPAPPFALTNVVNPREAADRNSSANPFRTATNARTGLHHNSPRRGAAHRHSRGHIGLAGVLLLWGAAAVTVAVWAGDTLERYLIARRWRSLAPGYELLANTETRYQSLALGRRAGQYSLYSDGHIVTDFPDPHTFAPLAHLWLCQHPAPRRVLVLGGGAEGLLAEILHHPVERVDYVEPDPRVIEFVRPYLTDADRAALADPRVSVHAVDARYYVKTQRRRFDLVLARLPEPTSALRARLFTVEFANELRRAMTDRAVLCLMAAAAPAELSPPSREYLATVRATFATHFPHLTVGGGDPAHVFAATTPGLVTTAGAELARRYAARGVRSALFDPMWFEGAQDDLDADQLARRRADLDRASPAAVSTDLRPIIYMQRLALWEAATNDRGFSGGASPRVVAWLRARRLGELVGVLVVLAGLVLMWPYATAGRSSRSVAIPAGTRSSMGRLFSALMRPHGRRQLPAGWADGAVVLSVATTGFATMALSLIWLFAFQNLYGYVYQRIGWIIALFMAGLVLGCLAAERLNRPPAPPSAFDQRAEGHRRGSSRTWAMLIGVDVSLAVLALAVPVLWPLLARLQTSAGALRGVEIAVSIMVVMTGVLGGAAFPLAAQLPHGAPERFGATAARVVAADHAGACLGALLCGVLLVPVCGTAATAWLLAGMKLVAAGTLAIGRRASAH